MNPRSCCDADSCIRKEIATLLDPDSPIVDRIYVAACAVAATCGKLTLDETYTCASRLFDVTPECDLAKAFVIAYQTERDVREAKIQIERQETSKYK